MSKIAFIFPGQGAQTCGMGKDFSAQTETGRISLDSLCRYYEIDNSNRTLHGALLDAELLAEVYLSLSRGQDTLTLVNEDIDNLPPMPAFDASIVIKASPEELAEHERILDIAEKKDKATPAWRKTAEPAESSDAAASA